MDHPVCNGCHANDFAKQQALSLLISPPVLPPLSTLRIRSGTWHVFLCSRGFATRCQIRSAEAEHGRGACGRFTRGPRMFVVCCAIRGEDLLAVGRRPIPIDGGFSVSGSTRHRVASPCATDRRSSEQFATGSRRHAGDS